MLIVLVINGTQAVVSHILLVIYGNTQSSHTSIKTKFLFLNTSVVEITPFSLAQQTLFISQVICLVSVVIH